MDFDVKTVSKYDNIVFYKDERTGGGLDTANNFGWSATREHLCPRSFGIYHGLWYCEAD